MVAVSMFTVKPENWITPPNKLVNPPEGDLGHMKVSRFALFVQARQSMLFNGLALLVIHSAMTGASKALKGRFIYPLKAAAIGALANATLYTAFLDGRSWYSSRDFRSFPPRFTPNKFFAGLFMFILAPFVSSKLSQYVIKTPVSLKVTYFGGAVSYAAITHMDGEKCTG